MAESPAGLRRTVTPLKNFKCYHRTAAVPAPSYSVILRLVAPVSSRAERGLKSGARCVVLAKHERFGSRD